MEKIFGAVLAELDVECAARWFAEFHRCSLNVDANEMLTANHPCGERQRLETSLSSGTYQEKKFVDTEGAEEGVLKNAHEIKKESIWSRERRMQRKGLKV